MLVVLRELRVLGSARDVDPLSDRSYPAKTLAIRDALADPGQAPTLAKQIEFRDGTGSGDVAEVASMSFACTRRRV